MARNIVDTNSEILNYGYPCELIRMALYPFTYIGHKLYFVLNHYNNFKYIKSDFFSIYGKYICASQNIHHIIFHYMNYIISSSVTNNVRLK